MREITIRTTQKEQFIDITDRVNSLIEEEGILEGICLLSSVHTTSGLTVNEGADPSVRADILKALDVLIPPDLPFAHLEGNSPAHIKASLMGNSVTLPVSEGRLVLGTWQSVYFCEFDGPRNRRVVVSFLSSDRSL